MSDWKSRAVPVPENNAASDWKSRAEAVPHENSAVDSAEQDFGDTLKGLGQGATLGFGDELLGAGQATKDVLFGDKKLADLAALYRQHQQENEKSWDEAKERSPWLTLGGEMAGGGLLSGPLGLTAKGLSKLQMAGRLGAAGAVAGAGGSKGTLEGSPEEIAKDAAISGALGGVVAPAVGNGIDKGVGKLAAMAEDSPLLNKLGYTWDAVKNRGQTFTGKKAGDQIRNDVNTAANSITKQFTQSLDDSSSLYGQAIDNAKDAGSKLGQGSDILKPLDAARQIIEQRGGGQTAKDALDLLRLHGSQTMNPETLQSTVNSLDPRQAKDLQLILRKLRGSPVYQGEGSLYDAEDALRGGLDKMLPDNVNTKINSTFSNARSVVEPLINKGQIDPSLQPKSVSDIDKDQLGGKINDYIKKLIKNGQDSNDSGVEAKGAFNDILSNAKNINEKAQTPFINPDQISTQFQDASMKNAVRKGIYGDRAQDTLSMPDKLLTGIAGSPYRAVEGAAKLAGGIERSNAVQVGKHLFSATDDNLRNIADKLNQGGMSYMGDALHSALDNKSTAAKNAILFSIMQNPNTKKYLGFDEEGSAK